MSKWNLGFGLSQCACVIISMCMCNEVLEERTWTKKGSKNESIDCMALAPSNIKPLCNTIQFSHIFHWFRRSNSTCLRSAHFFFIASTLVFLCIRSNRQNRIRTFSINGQLFNKISFTWSSMGPTFCHVAQWPSFYFGHVVWTGRKWVLLLEKIRDILFLSL